MARPMLYDHIETDVASLVAEGYPYDDAVEMVADRLHVRPAEVAWCVTAEVRALLLAESVR